MKIARVDRVYSEKTGKQTREAFVSFDDGSEYRGLFPDYREGDSVVLQDGMYVLCNVEGYEYEDEAEMVVRVARRNAEFFYKTTQILSFETYKKLTKSVKNIAILFEKNPYVLCEKEDEKGRPFADFPILDAATDIASFEVRLSELRLAAKYLLDQNESEGHIWMPYEEFDKKLRMLLKRGGHELITGDPSAIINYFPDFYFDEPLTLQSRVAKTSTRRKEYKIERIIRMYEDNDSLFRRYVPVEGNEERELTEEQKNAVRGAILSSGRFSVLTGGPGTGKTTVISAILDGMESAYPDVKIRLLAPTGKAAKRIQEQMGGREVEVSTIHRFIGYGMNFLTDEARSAIRKSGLVIIDESSMVDLEIFARLLDELDMGRTKVILVGDENQLPSVGAGNVLHDIIQMGVPCFRLTNNHRNAGSISDNAMKIIEGWPAFSLMEDEHFQIIDGGDSCLGYMLEVGKMERNKALISPYHREGLLSSTIEVNFAAKEHCFAINRRFIQNGGRSQDFNLGDRVICTHTNYKLGYMNGDTGVYAGKSGEMHTVRLDGSDVMLNVAEPDLELGYSITIHKSQGSEYDTVAVFIPKFSKFITRKMLYTAVTRAKEKVILYGDIFSIDEVIKNNKDDERRTFLGTIL